MKKRKKTFPKTRNDPKTLFLLFGVPLLLILSLALVFSQSKQTREQGVSTDQYSVKEYIESTSSAQTPDELVQIPNQSLISPPSSDFNIEPSVTVTPTATSTPTIVPTATPIPTKTPTPIPTLGPCSLCQYQINLFWGPVIKSFAGGKSYLVPVNRLIASASAEIAGGKKLPSCILYGAALVTVDNPKVTSGCEDPVTKKYLTGSVDMSHAVSPDGYAKGTITNNSSNCVYDVGFASYKMAKTGDLSADTQKQNIYDYRMVSIKPKETVEIYIRAPMQNDNPSCYKIPEPTVIALTPTLLPTPAGPGYDITVKSETVKTLWVESPRVKFSWTTPADIAGYVSNIYIRRWDDPPAPGEQYKDYQMKPNANSFVNWGLSKDADYYYKYCLEFKTYNKLICTNTIEVYGGVYKEEKIRIDFPSDFNKQVLGVSTDKKGSDEVFVEHPGLLRLFVRWLVRGNK
jgi:hypothetical protein